MKPYQYFLQLIRYRPRYYAADLTGITVHFLATTLFGLILRAFFNELTGSAEFGLTAGESVLAMIGYTVLVVGGLMLAMIAFEGNFQPHITGLMIRNMFARILAQPAADALPRKADGSRATTGELISTLRDDTKDLSIALILIDDIVGLGLMALVALFIMLRVNVLVTLGTFLPLALIIAVAQRLGEVAKRYRAQSRAATAEVTSLIADMFNAVEALKVAGAEDRVIGRFRQLNRQRQNAMVRDQFMTQLVDALSQGTIDLGLGLILLTAAQAMYRGSFTLGDFALFAAYIWPMTQLMRVAGTVLTRYKQSYVAIERMGRVMAGAAEGAVVAHNPIFVQHNAPPLPAPIKTAADRLEMLTAEALSYRFPDSENGIRNISLTVRRGEFVVVTGRIGSGKTTLLRVLLGLLPADGGMVRWNGRPIADLATFMVPPRVAYTAQVPRLFSETLRDNLLLGLPEEEVDLTGAIRAAVFEEDVAAMERGLETLVGPRGVRLSGGQVQRSAAARMFVRQPELYVFDDLSSALDVNTERTLWERLFALGERPTCLVVSHRQAALRRADRVMVLKDGRVEDEGSLDELLGRCEEMQRLWEGNQ